MPIYDGIAPQKALGGYARPDNRTGPTISMNRRDMNLHQEALDMQAAMRTLAAEWGAMPLIDQQSWPNAHSGVFVGRRGQMLLDDNGYLGRLAHLLPAAGVSYPHNQGAYVWGISAQVTFHQLTLNVGLQTLTVRYNNGPAGTGSARSGLKIFQVNPAKVGSPRVQDHTRLIHLETPFPEGNDPIDRTADCAWQTDDNAHARIISEWWDEGGKEGCNKTPFD